MEFICAYREFDKNNISLPSIRENISSVAINGKNKILQYMKSGKMKFASPAIVVDIFTNKPADIELCIYTDGVFAWSSETMYYFEKYNLKLNEDFINFVLTKNNLQIKE